MARPQGVGGEDVRASRFRVQIGTQKKKEKKKEKKHIIDYKK